VTALPNNLMDPGLDDNVGAVPDDPLQLISAVVGAAGIAAVASGDAGVHVITSLQGSLLLA
jgi:hypothetical protein